MSVAGQFMRVFGISIFSLLFAAPVVGVLDERLAAQEYQLKIPLGLREMKVPKDNLLTKEKIELGKQLYFDKRLSRDNSVSCATCHDPKKGWSNGERFATGIKGQIGARSAPTIINAAYQVNQFWDGRSKEVEGQALGPIQNPIEMDMTLPELTVRLNKIDGYRQQFQKVFGGDATDEAVGKAIGAFERTILCGNTPYDRFATGDKSALTEPAQRGMTIFFNKSFCSSCHPAPNFTDGAFHNVGVGMDQKEPDIGRQAVTKDLADRGSFKTPTLREIARTAPYMHDGSLKTLEDVIEHYRRGGVANPQLDEDIFPLKVTDEEKRDLITFLKEGLSSPDYPTVEPPELPK